MKWYTIAIGLILVVSIIIIIMKIRNKNKKNYTPELYESQGLSLLQRAIKKTKELCGGCEKRDL